MRNWVFTAISGSLNCLVKTARLASDPLAMCPTWVTVMVPGGDTHCGSPRR